VFGPVSGNRFVFYPYWWLYLGFWMKAAAEAAGFIRHLVRARLADWQWQSWAICGLLGLLLLASFIRFNLSFFQAQARYLFPALPPAALALCLGLEELGGSRVRGAALLAGVLLLAALAVGGLFAWVAPPFQTTALGGAGGGP